VVDGSEAEKGGRDYGQIGEEVGLLWVRKDGDYGLMVERAGVVWVVELIDEGHGRSGCDGLLLADALRREAAGLNLK
jgi:hypothetical protein